MTDNQALEDILNQGQTGFIILYQRYAKRLRYNLRCCKKIPEYSVNDVLQETFFQFFKNIKSFRGDCKIPIWLNQIATNVASDYLQKNKL